MDKETLSNYGWIVICVLVLAVMIALAGPFGTFVAGAVKSTTAGLFGVNQNALGAAGIDIEDQVFENCEHLETEIRNATADYSGDTCCKECGTVLSAGTYVIPTGGTYYDASENKTLTAGKAFPVECGTGDKYTYGEYEYRYNYYRGSSQWYEYEEQNGWGAHHLNKNNATPAPILGEINGKPLTSMNATFYGNKSITDMSTFVIPENVVNMVTTFMDCTSLMYAPTIPSGATTINGVFNGCKELKTVTINANPTSYNYTFCYIDMSGVTISGTSTMKQNIANTGTNGSQVTIID